MKYPGEDTIIKIISCFEYGVGALTRPWIIKRDGLANAQAAAEARRIDRLVQEQLREDIRDLRAGRKHLTDDFKLIEPPKSNADNEIQHIEYIKSNYLKAIVESQRYSPSDLINVEREINLQQIAALAIEESFEDDLQCENGSPDPDWFSQWRNRAQDVSNEDMQRLWGRILKGEVQSKGSFSIHTMDFLSRMSRKDAELIAKLKPYILADSFIFAKANDILERDGLRFLDLIYLEDLGLLNGTSGLLKQTSPTIKDNSGKFTVFKNNQVALVLYVKDSVGSLKTPVYSLSNVAKQILILAEDNLKSEYLAALAKHHEDKCEKVMIGTVANVEGSKFEVQNLHLFSS